MAALIRGYLCTICKSAQLATLRCIENKYKLNEFNSIFCTLRLIFPYIKFKITPRLKPEYFFKYFYIYPCNSGFFFTLKTINISAFQILECLNKQNISINVLSQNYIRICFSSVDLNKLFETFLDSIKLMS